MTPQTRDQLLGKQTANTAALDKLKAEVAEISKNAPAARSQAQNDRLQAIEKERQALVEEAETIAADLAKLPAADPKKAK
jgi:ribosomal 50S subunit-associated protein YjgA (DUF615 family)